MDRKVNQRTILGINRTQFCWFWTQFLNILFYGKWDYEPKCKMERLRQQWQNFWVSTNSAIFWSKQSWPKNTHMDLNFERKTHEYISNLLNKNNFISRNIYICIRKYTGKYISNGAKSLQCCTEWWSLQGKWKIVKFW